MVARELTDLELLHGVDGPLASVQVRRAGAFDVAFDGITVRRVYADGIEVLRGVYPAVRDPGWGTLPLRVLRTEESHEGGGFRVEVEGDADDGAIALSFDLTIEGTASELTVALTVAARRAFEYGRIGLNVLLPPAVAGCGYTTDAGEPATFPVAISPQRYDDAQGVYEPMFASFRQLEVTLPARQIALSFTGDEFEVEDQRNWTDASFKVYSTPLRLGYPHTARAGQRFEQRVKLEVTG